MTAMQQLPSSTADLSWTVEDYLRTILLFKESHLRTSQQYLAETFQVSIPTVSNTLKRMEREGLVYRDQLHHVQLSPLGQIAAECVMRRNRLVECFLYQILKVPFGELAREADRLEHTVTARVERSLYLLLGRPSTCPHGNPLEVSANADPVDASLAAFRFGEITITRILELATTDSDFMQWLEHHDLTPGHHFTIERRATGHTVLSQGGRQFSVPAPAGELIMARHGRDPEPSPLKHPTRRNKEQ